MKRMPKASVMKCAKHVFEEQHVTRNIAHPFCLRSYASFQVRAMQHATATVLPPFVAHGTPAQQQRTQAWAARWHRSPLATNPRCAWRARRMTYTCTCCLMSCHTGT